MALELIVLFNPFHRCSGIRDVSNWSAKMAQPLIELYGRERLQTLLNDWCDGFQRLGRENDGEICSDDLKRIECRTLIVHGAKDPMIDAEHVPHLRKHIKNNEFFEFPDGKHNIHLRYADEFNKLISGFLTCK